MDRLLAYLSSVIYSELLPLISAAHPKTTMATTTVASTTAKLTSTTAKITTTSASVKAKITTVSSTVPASSVKTSSTPSSSVKSTKNTVSTSSTPNTDRALSSISSATSASISPVVSDNIPSISNQAPPSVSIIVPSEAPSLNTSGLAAATTSALPKPSSAFALVNKVLILAPDDATADTTETPLDGYGMAYDTYIVPKAGITLPTLNTTGTDGTPICNYNIIVVHSQLSYNYGDTTSTGAHWASALTADQWKQLYDYQVMCNVRMVHFNVWPSSYSFGADAIGGCCDTKDPQNATIVAPVADARFPTAGLNAVPLDLTGLYHIPSKISDMNTTQTTEFLQFSPNAAYPTTTTGGVINTYADGRSQMAFFISFGTWSPTSAYLNHIWIHWGTHGLYDGYRRAHLSTQIDDVLLSTSLYSPSGSTFRTTVADLTKHSDWVTDINSRLTKTNPGSQYVLELGLNGNGNLLQANVADPKDKTCLVDPIWYAKDPDETPLEFQKTLGTGTDCWPTTPTSFSVWPLACYKLDPLAVYLWATAKTSKSFFFVSHTFTHESLNNATYSDTFKEINWNLQYFKLAGLDTLPITSLNGLIPPAITGLHNGDALRAFSDNGLWNAVGDNTRPPLRNTESPFWPLITTIANNGFDGYQVTPRWATRIYFNCNTPACTTLEWQQTSGGGSSSFDDLLEYEQESTSNNLLSLMHDPYMFHQANLCTNQTTQVTIPGTSMTGTFSLLQSWVETQVAEFQRLVTWPLITLKHDDVATSFKNRYLRDQCDTRVQQGIVNGNIVGVTVTTTDNKCSAPVPVTIPGGVKETGSYLTTEAIGKDPATVWVTMSGSPVTLTLKNPISVSKL
ncbi:hypothetical protein AA313_de0205982 [Arthrobotrys entomopaga]|nr:hypothetical protein AA313_de0205982 [Arthrobotrys entomopaga]